MTCSNLVLVAIMMFTAQSVMSTSYEDIIDACKKNLGYDGDITKLKFEDPEFPSKAKCVMACGFEKKGMFKADGSLDKDKEKAIVEEIIKGEEMKKKFFHAIEECDSSAKANKCETAFQFLKCIHKKAIAH